MTIRKVERRGETRLFIDITWKKKDGTKGRYRHDAQVQTMAAARAEERRLLANIAQYGEPFEPMPDPPKEELTKPMSITFSEAVELFQKGKAVTELKPTTRITYDEILKTRLLPRFGDRPLDSLGYEDASTLDAELVKEGLSASRRRNVAIVFRSMLRHACEAGKLTEMPKLPALPKVGRTILKTLTMVDVEKILAVASLRARLALGLAAYAGLRAGEIRGLRWSDVDITARFLVVRRSTSKGETAPPKSGHEREVPLADQLVALLQAVGPRKGHALVAITSKGQPWGEFGLLQALRRAVTKAGILGHWRVHDLRHAFVTELFRRGGSGPAVQALAGHASLQVTQRYAHVARADLQATIGLLGGYGNSRATASGGNGGGEDRTA